MLYLEQVTHNNMGLSSATSLPSLISSGLGTRACTNISVSQHNHQTHVPPGTHGHPDISECRHCKPIYHNTQELLEGWNHLRCHLCSQQRRHPLWVLWWQQYCWEQPAEKGEGYSRCLEEHESPHT